MIESLTAPLDPATGELSSGQSVLTFSGLTNLDAVACSSTTQCLFVGDTPAPEGEATPLDPATGAISSGENDQTISGSSHFFDVACPSSAQCLAVGQGLSGDVGVGVAVPLNPATGTLTGTQVVPTVSSVSPDRGPVTGGTAITITGTGFIAGASVEIGMGSTAISATEVRVVSATEITAVTGGEASAGTFNLFVTTSGGTSAANPGDDFTYVIPRPTVSSVSPNRGPVTGGTAITITGTGFIAGASVVIRQGPRTITATDVTVVSPRQITAVTGGRACPGTFNLFVTTSGGISAANPGDDFTYNRVHRRPCHHRWHR